MTKLSGSAHECHPRAFTSYIHEVIKGVKKVRSAIKLHSHYFSYNVSNNIIVTGILLSRLT